MVSKKKKVHSSRFENVMNKMYCGVQLGDLFLFNSRFFYFEQNDYYYTVCY